MELVTFLEDNREVILAESMAGMERARMKHYDNDGVSRTRKRLSALFDLTLESVRSRQLTPMITHARQIGKERFAAGFDLFEVQTAFNILEEVIWKRIINEIPAEELAHSLGMISTVLGAGKEKLALTYVSQASREKSETLNLTTLFGEKQNA